VDESLRDAVESLAPWHFDIRLSDDFTTRDGNTTAAEGAPIAIVDPDELRPLLTKLYPEGLKGRTFLDVGCNGGGYSILAKRLGADYAYGFDARAHWIDQANFLKRTLALTDIDFDHAAVHEATLSRSYDVTLFKGIFYHLPDPVHALERVCAVTHDAIIVDTATDGTRGEYLMRLNPEGQEHLMTGVHGLAWWPSGPDLVAAILARFGFVECREVFWKPLKNGGGGRARPGRCRIVAARTADRLARLIARAMDPYPPSSQTAAASPTGKSLVDGSSAAPRGGVFQRLQRLGRKR